MTLKNKFYFVSGLLIVDQLIKFLVINFLTKPITIIGDFFQLNYVQNFGVGFSLLNGNKYLILAISILLLYLVVKMLKDPEYKNFEYPLLLILAGGIGNLIDRIFRGFVVDYMDFRIFNYDFPVFNFADMCLVLGAIVMIILMLKEEGGK